MFKKLLKASLTLLCSALLAGSLFVSAHEESEVFTGESYLETEGYYFSFTSEASLMEETVNCDLESGTEKLLNGLLERKDEITFDDDDFVFEIPNEYFNEDGEFLKDKFSATQFSTLYYKLTDEHPELFYIANNRKFSYSYQIPEDGFYRITRIAPGYRMTEEETKKAKKDFKERTKKIAQYANGDNHSDLEKAMLLHDYIILNCEYDMTKAHYDAYTMLTEGIGVCESYSKLYRYLLGLCGINSKYSESLEMNHVWNLVELDGEWYHADLTWDDPTPNIPGYVRYDYFLVGDEDFKSSDIYGENNHFAFTNEDGIQCTETYEDSFWGICAEETGDGFIIDEAPIVFDKNNYYYTSYKYNSEEGHICAITARSKADGTEKNIVEFDENWGYIGNYSGLSLVDGVIIYNTPNEVRYVLPNGKHNTLIKKIQKKDSHFGDTDEGYIYRFGTSLDGKFREREPFYTHIETPNSKNNGGWHGDAKDKYRIEIDYYISTQPFGKAFFERNIDVHVDFSDIHHYANDKEAGKNESAIKENIKKPTYITKGKKEKICKVCGEVSVEEIPANCTQGEDGHTPTITDINDIIKGVMGTGKLSDDITNVDVDGDEKATMHDINELFKLLREQHESEKTDN